MLSLLSALLLSAQWLGAVNGEKQTQPNFLVVLVDDWAFGDAGFNGYGAETPNLDQLASEGMVFGDMHANSVCTPSRAALQTGRYNMRAGIHSNFDIDSEGGLSLDEITIGQFLSNAGYRTSATGKWHLGHSHNTTSGLGYHPTWRGYDHYTGVPWSIDMGCTNSALTPGGKEKQGCPSTGPANRTGNAIPLYNSTSHCSGPGPTCSNSIIQQPADLTQLDDFYAEAVDAFLAPHSPSGVMAGTPFFAYIPFSHVHVPLSHNPKYQNASKRNTLFADTLLEMDATVGRIMASLKAYQLDTSTLVLVVGDNGRWDAYCEDAGSPGPFIGGYMKPAGTGTGKFTTWEGGHREASLAWFPGRIPANTVSNVTLHIMDFFPTLASLAGLPLPKDRTYDGVDMSPVMFNGASTTPRAFLFHQSDNNFTAARFGKYKAHFATWSAQGCSVPGQPRVFHNPPLVFDLDTDPGETTPLLPSEMPSGLQARFVEEWNALMLNISSSSDTHVSIYRDGGFPFFACCNASHPACAC